MENQIKKNGYFFKLDTQNLELNPDWDELNGACWYFAEKFIKGDIINFKNTSIQDFMMKDFNTNLFKVIQREFLIQSPADEIKSGTFTLTIEPFYN